MNEMKNLWRGREKNEKQTSVTNEIKKARQRQKYLTCVLGKRTVTTKSVWQEKEKEKESRARVSLRVYLCARKRLAAVVVVVVVVNRRQNTPTQWSLLLFI